MTKLWQFEKRPPEKPVRRPKEEEGATVKKINKNKIILKRCRRPLRRVDHRGIFIYPN